MFASILFAVAITWKPIQTGVEFAVIPPGLLYVVRIDPTRAKLAAGIASRDKREPQTAAAWSRTSRFSVVTNLGMFNDDHLEQLPLRARPAGERGATLARPRLRETATGCRLA
jgi:hypothetical protein